MGRVCHAYSVLLALRQCKESRDMGVDEGVYEAIVDGVIYEVEKADIEQGMPELCQERGPVGCAEAQVKDGYGVKVGHL